VRIGVTVFATDLTIDPVTLARAAEERGFASLYLPEHTHIPSSRLTAAPTGSDELPEEYRRTIDPLVALAAAAAITSHLGLGTGVLLAAQHDPIVTAKQIATIDWLSGGRFTLGVGFGWNREEMAGHGVEYSTRRDRVREHVLAMRALWRDEVAAFDGRYVHLEPSWQWPKPCGGRVRTLVGGAAGAKLFAHVVEWSDGWMPIGGAGVREQLPALRRAWAAAGRVGEPEVVPFGVVPSERKLDYYRSLGIPEVVLRLPGAPRDESLRLLDTLAGYLQ